jgi:hypothetical protein
MADSASCLCRCQTTDSGLSIAANIISIVTLAWALYIGVTFRIESVLRGKWFLLDLEQRVNDFMQKLRGTVDIMGASHDFEDAVGRESLLRSLDTFRNTAARMQRLQAAQESRSHWRVVLGSYSAAKEKVDLERTLDGVQTELDSFVNFMYVCLAAPGSILTKQWRNRILKALRSSEREQEGPAMGTLEEAQTADNTVT